MARPTRLVRLPESEFRRIAGATRRVERTPLASAPEPRYPLSVGDIASSFSIIKTSSTITARSGVTPGTGTATKIGWDGSALTVGTTITVRNISGHTGGIGTGLYGFAVKLFGVWWVVVVECP